MSVFSKKGFSIVEVMIAGVIMSIVFFAATQFFGTYSKVTRDTSLSIDSDLDSLILERMVRKTIVSSAPSLNTIEFDDDSGNNFFDYLPDYKCLIDCKRQIRLSATSTNKLFPFLSPYNGSGGHKLYAPQFAYRIGTANTLTVAGTLSWAGVNGNNSGDGAEYLEKLYGKYNADSQKVAEYDSLVGLGNVLVLFQSLVALRNMGAPSTTMNTPPRKSIYLGNLNTETFNIVAVNPDNLFDLSHPQDSSIFMNDTADASGTNGLDKFLRTLPPVGGVNALAAFKNVKLSRYKFIPGATKEKNAIVLENWDPQTNAWGSNAFQAGTNLYAIDIIRRNISTPVMEIIIHDKLPPQE